MNRALIVGIDYYPDNELYGCVQDATRMTEILARNSDGAPNFNCKTLIAKRGGRKTEITRRILRDDLRALFAEGTQVAMFYFAGHGEVSDLGGYLLTQDYEEAEGVDMEDILTLANRSKVPEVVIILDCCHSGAFGRQPSSGNQQVHLREGVSVLTAARPTQLADEHAGGGLFTNLVCEALDGGAADIRGRVTAAGVYAFVDQALGAWQQRPMFQSHVARLLPLRTCAPKVADAALRRIPQYFPEEETELKLDPSFDPELEPKDEKNEAIYTDLQAYRDAGLLSAVGEKHLYHAARTSKGCRLTNLGRFYWKLASEGKL